MMMVTSMLTCNVQAIESSSVQIDTSKLYRGLLVIIQINDFPVFIMNRRLSEINALRKLHADSQEQVIHCSDCDPVLRSISPDYLVIWGHHPNIGCELAYASSTSNSWEGHKVHGIGGFVDKCSDTEYDLTGRKLTGPDTSPAELGIPFHKLINGKLEIGKQQHPGGIYASRDCDHAIKLARNNDYQPAIQMANICIANNNTDTNSRIWGYRALAWGYFGLSDFSNAAKYQRIVLSLGGYNYNDNINAGLFFRFVNELDESLKVLKWVDKLDKKENRISIQTQYHLGWTYYELGNYEQAIKAFTNGILSQSDYAFVYYRRGLAYHSLGRKEEAKSDFIKFNELLTPETVTSQVIDQQSKDELIEKQDLLADYGVFLSLKSIE